MRFLRNVKLLIGRATKKRFVTLDGVKVSARAEALPKHIQSLLYKKIYEDAERALVRQSVRSGSKVLEIGAGIGVIGLLAARLAGHGNVVSYEANPDLRLLINENHELNKVSPELRMRAVTVDGNPVVFHKSNNIISSSLHERDETHSVTTVESDALVDVLEELRPNIIVMDVEGAEIDLLVDLALTGVEALLVELHPHIVGQEKIDALLASLETRGFVVTADRDKNVLLKRMMS